MKKIVAFLLLFLSSTLFNAQSKNPDAVLGTWLTASGKAKVQIYKEGNKYNGKIVWLRNPNYEDGKIKVDKNNPDKAKQSVPLVGLNMLKNFVFDDDEWEDGTIYDPENGKTYSCTIKFRNGMLDLRGYIGISLIGRTQTWFKVEDFK
ncbi:DUF2147 domain-containing protein [Aurantibacillus circumpalustris]|uniref:DUF2147 domain-containing protein n=1 Tax=Aurantibacillus circumpalustris TaxID=3036359 RepID=UPI00295B4060|nr:DUF2147 domain-containing protein [Aurantibacillus circumpalustris]